MREDHCHCVCAKATPNTVVGRASLTTQVDKNLAIVRGRSPRGKPSSLAKAR